MDLWESFYLIQDSVNSPLLVQNMDMDQYRSMEYLKEVGFFSKGLSDVILGQRREPMILFLNTNL
jgi:hypothetical protein